MSFKYVGRVNSFKGKSLFEILFRLKNYGLGRIVYRNRFMERYPEPSYFVISKVVPDTAMLVDPRFSQISTAWGFKVFRGEPSGESVIRSGYKSDWILVPREDEQNFLAREFVRREVPIIPNKNYFPPLLEHLIIQDQRRKGLEVEERPMYPIDIMKLPTNFAVLEGEDSFLKKADPS